MTASRIPGAARARPASSIYPKTSGRKTFRRGDIITFPGKLYQKARRSSLEHVVRDSAAA
jgi:hypothetical protein